MPYLQKATNMKAIHPFGSRDNYDTQTIKYPFILWGNYITTENIQ